MPRACCTSVKSPVHLEHRQRLQRVRRLLAVGCSHARNGVSIAPATMSSSRTSGCQRSPIASSSADDELRRSAAAACSAAVHTLAHCTAPHRTVLRRAIAHADLRGKQQQRRHGGAPAGDHELRRMAAQRHRLKDSRTKGQLTAAVMRGRLWTTQSAQTRPGADQTAPMEWNGRLLSGLEAPLGTAPNGRLWRCDAAAVGPRSAVRPDLSCSQSLPMSHSTCHAHNALRVPEDYR